MPDLNELRARIPSTNCRGLCTDSCGPVPVAPAETTHLAAAGIPVRPATATAPAMLPHRDATCTLLAAGRCTVYADRPLMCRLWGAVDTMPCPHGCAPTFGRLPDSEARRVLRDAGVRPGLSATRVGS